MALINPLIGSNLVTGAAPFDSTLIGNSVWLDGSADYLNRTPSSAGNRTRWTLAWWFQLNAVATDMAFFSANNGSNDFFIRMDGTSNQQMMIMDDNASMNCRTVAFQRDVGWYHCIMSYDSNQGVAKDRIQIYLNGERQEVSFQSAAEPSSGGETFWNNNQNHEIGRRSRTSGSHANAYMAQIVFLNADSIQNGDVAVTDFLDTFTFGTNGSQFVPKKDSDIAALATAAGGNSFCLDFADTSNFGNDISGNSPSGENDFTANSMAASNQSLNTPSNVYPKVSNIGIPSGSTGANYTMTSGSNRMVYSGSNQGYFGLISTQAIQPDDPKIYWEHYLESGSVGGASGGRVGVGLAAINFDAGNASGFVGAGGNNPSNVRGVIYDNGSQQPPSGGAADTSATLVPVGGIGNYAYEPSTGKFWVGLNGTWNNGSATASTTLNPSSHDYQTTPQDFVFFLSAARSTDISVLNFGDNPTFSGNETAGGNSDANGHGNFKYAVPSGFLAPCSANLTAPDYQGIDYFDATLYEGNGTGQRVGDFVPFTDAYAVSNSVMFMHDEVRSLSRTIEAPSAGAPAKKGTWSIWFKTGNIDTDCVFFDNGTTATNRFSLQMDASGQIVFSHGGTTILKTSADFKGDGAWHNLVLKVDTALSSASARAIMFMDGVEQTSFETDSRSSLSQDAELGYMDEGATQFVGSYNGSSANQWDGYLAEAVFLDNEFENASSFGQLDTSTNRWIPKDVSGLTFGNCGFYLEFKTSSLSDGTLIAQGTGTPIGNMTAGGGLAAAFDGDIENYNAGAQSNSTSGNIGKDWGSGVTKTVTGVAVKMLGNVTIDGGAADETMTLTVERSDNGTDFTQIYTQSGIVVGNGHTVTRRMGFSNTAAARYARVSVSHGGGAETHISELEFYENGSVLGSDLGTDTSGNGNHFTMSNGSGESGLPDAGIWETADQFIDTPSLNFATIDPVISNGGTPVTVSEGNLTGVRSSSGFQQAYSNFSGFRLQENTGIYFAEVLVGSDTSNFHVGVLSGDPPSSTNRYLGQDSNTYGYAIDSGNKVNSGTYVSYGATYTAGDVIGIEIDTDTGSINFHKNGSDQGQAFTAVPGPYSFAFASESNGGPGTFNFGQQLALGGASTTFNAAANGNFKHTPPTGAKALNQDNLDATASKITAWAWIKNRDATDNHILVDRVRGVGKDLHSNSDPSIGDIAPAEVTNMNTVQRFFQRGVQIGSDVEVNTANESYVLWQWLLGDTATSATSFAVDSISSGVPNLASTSLVADADHFAIVSYTGAGGSVSSSNTIRHGMTGAPEMIWVKERDHANGWIVSTTDIGFNKVVRLDVTAEEGVDDGAFKSTAPTSTLITLGSNSGTNRSGGKMICYAFRSVPGVCKIGTYIGNGDGTGSDTVNGPYVNCGFRPRWILFKWLSGGSLSAEGWVLKDTARQIINPNDDADLVPNGSNAEAAGATHGADILSDGFKIRGGGGAVNKSGAKYLYMAMADIGGNGTLPPIYGR
jgi:hypothetical protein